MKKVLAVTDTALHLLSCVAFLHFYLIELDKRTEMNHLLHLLTAVFTIEITTYLLEES